MDFKSLFDLIPSVITIISTIASFAHIIDDFFSISSTLWITVAILTIIITILYYSKSNRIKMYNNLSERKQFYSLMYVNYVNAHMYNKKNKIRSLSIQFDMSKQNDMIIDSRNYSFCCKKNKNNLKLSFIHDEGYYSKYQIMLNNKLFKMDFVSAGYNEKLNSSQNNIIIESQGIPLKHNSNSIIFDYKFEHKTYKKTYVRVLYPKMFSKHVKWADITIIIDEELKELLKYNTFIIYSISKNKENIEGYFTFDNTTNSFKWSGRICSDSIYIIRSK